MFFDSLFYGECEEVDEVDNTIEGSGLGANKITSPDRKSEVGSGMFMSVGLNPNPQNRFTCENMNCQFVAKCKYNPEGAPYCACQVLNNLFELIFKSCFAISMINTDLFFNYIIV
jgi:hypothetical protein